MADFKPIGLGDRVKDPITGLTGIATSVCVFLHGCIRIGVQSETCDKDGKIADPQYFDQSQLVLVKPDVHRACVMQVAPIPPRETRRSNGGPARETKGFSLR